MSRSSGAPNAGAARSESTRAVDRGRIFEASDARRARAVDDTLPLHPGRIARRRLPVRPDMAWRSSGLGAAALLAVAASAVAEPLMALQDLTHDDPGVAGLLGAASIAVSPDARNVYVVSTNNTTSSRLLVVPEATRS